MNVLVVAAHGLNCHWLGPYGNEWVDDPGGRRPGLARPSSSTATSPTTRPRPASGQLPTALLTPSGLRGSLSPSSTTGRPGTPTNARGTFVRTDRPSDPDARRRPCSPRSSALDALADRPRAGSCGSRRTGCFRPGTWSSRRTSITPPRPAGSPTTDERGRRDPRTDGRPAAGPFDVETIRGWHRLRNSFAAAVTSFDAELGGWSAVFRQAGLDQSAAWIVTSGYGCPLGEHGIVGPAGRGCTWNWFICR